MPSKIDYTALQLTDALNSISEMAKDLSVVVKTYVSKKEFNSLSDYAKNAITDIQDRMTKLETNFSDISVQIKKLQYRVDDLEKKVYG